MRPQPRKDKTGKITNFQLRVYIGENENGTKQFERRKWVPDREYTSLPKLMQAADRAQLNFEDEVKERRKRLVDNDYTFEEFSAIWMKKYCEPHNGLKTTDAYKSMLIRINDGIGEKKLKEITPMQLNDFLLSLMEPGKKQTGTGDAGLSPKSIKNYRSVISSIYSTAVKWEVVVDNPAKKVDSPKIVKKDIDVFEIDEVKRLFLLLDEEAPLKYNLFIRLAIYSGMRRGEMLGLKWDCIDFNHNIVVVKRSLTSTKDEGIFLKDPKTSESMRSIKISASLMEIFKLIKQEQEQNIRKLNNDWIRPADKINFVFTQWNGEPMNPNTPYLWFTRFQDRHGLKHHSIHSLRHTNATLLIMNGANVKVVSGRLGHSNTGTTTNIYTSYLKSADAIAADILDGIFDDKSEE